MGVWERSKMITKMSFSVIRADKEMLVFPILAGLSSIAFMLAMLVPTIISDALHGRHVDYGPLEMVLTFVTYAGLAFLATFFNTCVVYTTKTRLEGGDATFMQSLSFALSKVHLIFMWSLVAATVGMLLRSLDNAGRRSGMVGAMVLGIVRSIIGAAWAIATIFVVPVMVYEGVGPFQAISRSIATVKKTWGESLVRHYGLGLFQFVMILPALLLGVGVVVLMQRGLMPGVGITALALLGVYVLATALVFTVANTVFNTALYAYASRGALPDGFSRDVMQGVFRRGK